MGGLALEKKRGKHTVGEDVAGGESDFRVLDMSTNANWAFMDILSSGLGSIHFSKKNGEE